jgi:hypothetical protein
MSRSVITADDNIWKSDGSGVIQQDGITIAHLYEFYLDTPVFTTDFAHDLTYTSATSGGSQTYSESLFITGMSDVVETATLKVGKISIQVSGADNADIETMLNDTIVNKRLVVYRAYINEDGAFESGSPYMFFDGNVESYSIKESPKDSAITITVATHYANFLQTNGRSTNPNSQHSKTFYNNTSQYFADDRGMDFSSSMVRDIKWGQE